ncbi:multiple coagulation factor deficiency protein 2 homolog [Parasteatoda tepidariorum]|uniref:multiple coagulation factor deficiency protein 2 homolog n=1 Tax=Parasteatoda tepidariorum TaxID=114398 RepID=UPI00077FCBC4|nr:multiple coagulation factor deficiency protein 2 homolog [Parasteatoda tepidariorum]
MMKMIWRIELIPLLASFLLAEELNTETKIKVDKEHLEFDFAGIFGDVADIFSNFDIDFQYFALHDFDENQRLDGLELLVALIHHSDEEETNSVKEGNLLLSVEKQVDDIFKDHDTNNDGFLSYKEFMSVQRVYPDLSSDGGK